MNATGHVYISGYTDAPYGAGPGVVRFALESDGTVGERQAAGGAGAAGGADAGAVNPSFMVLGGTAVDGEFLLAVEELPEGRIAALDPVSLAIRGQAPSGGADPCHLMLLGPDIWAANYTSGTASVTALSELLERPAFPERTASAERTASPERTTAAPPALLSHPGSGPVPGRQEQSHAHQVTATPWGTVLVSDLGADRLDEYTSQSKVLVGSAQLPPGTGPRHVALKGDYLLVDGELDGYLHVLRRTGSDAHSWQWLFRTPLAATAQEIADVKDFAPSHIELSADGTLLYAAVRGSNTLVVLDVAVLLARAEAQADAAAEAADRGKTATSRGGAATSQERVGENGAAENGVGESSAEKNSGPIVLSQSGCGGSCPRHFVIGNNKMYVTNQLSNNVSVFELDGNGLPGSEPVQTLEFGSPTCIVLG